MIVSTPPSAPPPLPRAKTPHLLLGKPRVHHVHDAVDGQRRLGHVGRHHHLSPHGAPRKLGARRLSEYLLLGRRRQRRVQRVYRQLSFLRWTGGVTRPVADTEQGENGGVNDNEVPMEFPFVCGASSMLERWYNLAMCQLLTCN